MTTLKGTETWRVTPLRSDGGVSPYDELVSIADIASFFSGQSYSLPAAQAGALGGVLSVAPVAHRFLTGVGTGGVFITAQPAFSDIGGQVAPGQIVFGVGVGQVAQGNDARIVSAQQTNQKGQASGYAGLDGNSHVPYLNLPIGTGPNTVASGLALAAETTARQSLTSLLTIGGIAAVTLDTGAFAINSGTLTTTNPVPVADGSTITSTVGTDGNTTFTANYLPPDLLTIVPINGSLSVNSQPLFSLLDRGSLQPTDAILVTSNTGTSYLGTFNEMLTFIGNSLSPAISIDLISSQAPSTPFSVTGTLGRYNFVPTLSVSVNGGTLTPISSLGGTATAANGSTPGTFSFTQPGLSVSASDTINVQDANGVMAASNVFAVSNAVPTAASLSNIPATGVHGVALTGITGTMTPATGATAWVVLYGPNGFEGPRLAWVGGSAVPNMTPLVAGNYKPNVFSTSTGGTKLFSASSYTVVS